MVAERAERAERAGRAETAETAERSETAPVYVCKIIKYRVNQIYEQPTKNTDKKKQTRMVMFLR